MPRSFPGALCVFASAVMAAVLAACGGGASSQGNQVSVPTSVQVSGTSGLSASCGTAVPSGSTQTFTAGSAIQPQAAASASTLVGVWEQDRWTGLGARAILAARSTDAGATWSAPAALPFSACGGGTGPGAGFDRASDPWVSFAGNGVVIASALAFSAGGYLASGGLSAVLVARSTDGGVTWSTPVAVQTDQNPGTTGPFYFNDRDSVTADPSNGHVYLVWDRLTTDATASVPTYLARSTDAGATWSTRLIYDPGAGNEAFNNQIAILPNGDLLDFFTLFTGALTTSLQVIRSTDGGLTWSTTPFVVANPMTSVGTTNPITNGSIRDSALMAQVAADPASGNVAAVWQQMFASGAFDGIALSVSKDSGATWSAPKQINGVKTAGAFSPTVRYLPGGVIAVTYYDLRDFVTGSSVLGTDAWLTESSDGGTTWHEVRLQAAFDLNKAPLANLNGSGALFLGDNQGLALVGSSALPFYAATNGGGAHVYATQAPDPLTLATARVYTASVSAGAPPP